MRQDECIFKQVKHTRRHRQSSSTEINNRTFTHIFIFTKEIDTKYFFNKRETGNLQQISPPSLDHLYNHSHIVMRAMILMSTTQN